MTPKEFRQYWKQQPFVKLYTFKPERVDIKSIKQETAEFLTTYGIPSDAAPSLNFSKNYFKEFQTSDQYFGFDEPTLKHYLVIGNNGCGDPVCIDTGNNDEIVVLNHDNNFEKTFINTNIERFMLCLTAYCEFIKEVNTTGRSYVVYGAEKQQLERIRSKLLAIDVHCLNDESLWSMELAARQ